MHNNFLDRRRRNLRLQPDQVDLILPEHFAAQYPKFISLLKFYYEFQNEEKATELLRHLFASRDITETDIELLSYIEDELLLGDSYFESFATGDAQKRAAANFSNTLFRTKGTKFAIQWFFRSFFGLDAEVVETKDNIFEIGDPNSQIGPNSLHYITDDKLYQTFAYLIRTEIPISKWRELFKLFVHPAGMYLGAELLIKDETLVSLLSEDSDGIITTSTSPVYNLTVTPSTEESEGTTFNFALTGTNASNGTYLYYIDTENFTASQNDFVFASDSVFPDSANKRTLDFTGGSASFDLQIRTDSDESEGTETFRVYFQDPEGRSIATSDLNIVDAESKFSIAASSTSITEGDSVQFTVTGIRDVPNDGSTNLYYRLNPISADSDDFLSGSFPATGSKQSFAMRNNTAEFSVQTTIDGNWGSAEGDETFNVTVFTQSDILKATSDTITVTNTTPQFDFVGRALTEGEDIVVGLSVDPVTVGQTVEYSIEVGDNRIVTNTGSFEITSPTAEYVLSQTSISDAFDSVISLVTLETLTQASGGYYNPVLSNTANYAIGSVAPSFTSIVPDLVGQTNDEDVTFTITGTNIPDGNSAKYYIDLISPTETADFDLGGSLPVSVGTAVDVSFTSNSGSVTLGFAAGSETTNEEFDIVIIDTDDVEVLRLRYAIAGEVVYGLTTPAGGTANEGDTLTLTFDHDGGSNGTYYYYVSPVTGSIDADDFTSGHATSSSRATFAVSSTGTNTGEGDIQLVISSDRKREGSEVFRVFVSETATGAVIAQSGNITISDTSTQTYTMSMADITEGSPLNAIVSPDVGNDPSDETIFVNFDITSGNNIVLGDSTTLGQVVNITTGNKSFISTTASTSTVDGDRTITATAHVGSPTGTQVATTTCTISDAAPSYTLTTNKTNDSANEGDTIQFSFGGTNVPSGIYYYILSDINYKIIGTNQATNIIENDIIYLGANNDLSNLQTGMEIRGLFPEQYFDSEATITLISDIGQVPPYYDYIQMSENASSNVAYSAPQGAYFALPQVWEDFDDAGAGNGRAPYGSFTHTTGTTSTFSVDVSDTGDVADPATTTYTMQVKSSHGSSGTVYKTRSFTIYDGDENPAPNVQRGDLTNPQNLYGNFIGVLDGGSTGQVKIIFNSSGSITVERVDTDVDDTGALITDSYGNWVDDTDTGFDANDFEIRAVEISETNPFSQVDTGDGYGSDFFDITGENSRNEFGIRTVVPSEEDQLVGGDKTIDITIREKDDPTNNVFTTRITLFVSTRYIDGDQL